MDTLKNFFVGLFVIVLSSLILGLVLLTWPVIIGIGSVLLSFLAAILFVVMIFYIIVLVGHLVRQLLKRS